MLVNLLNLPPLGPIMLQMNNANTIVRRPQPFEITQTLDFIEREFSVAWADEISVGFANKPVTVYIATVDKEIIGFAAYECTRRGFFGPTGVVDSMRARGVGKALLLASLWGLREMGYVYGIIGRVGPIAFYEKAVGAIVIADSEPGIYTDLLK
jgi:GNAT superfamily N-acetyltransferase